MDRRVDDEPVLPLTETETARIDALAHQDTPRTASEETELQALWLHRWLYTKLHTVIRPLLKRP